MIKFGTVPNVCFMCVNLIQCLKIDSTGGAGDVEITAVTALKRLKQRLKQRLKGFARKREQVQCSQKAVPITEKRSCTVVQLPHNLQNRGWRNRSCL